jgi:hypothetical protein
MRCEEGMWFVWNAECLGIYLSVDVLAEARGNLSKDRSCIALIWNATNVGNRVATESSNLNSSIFPAKLSRLPKGITPSVQFVAKCSFSFSTLTQRNGRGNYVLDIVTWRELYFDNIFVTS